MCSASDIKSMKASYPEILGKYDESDTYQQIQQHHGNDAMIRAKQQL